MTSIYEDLKTIVNHNLLRNEGHISQDEIDMCKRLLTFAETKLIEERHQKLITYKKWFDNLINNATPDEVLDYLYDSTIDITVAGRTIQLPFDADTYNNVEFVLRRAIEEF